jgi:hypothetical protein
MRRKSFALQLCKIYENYSYFMFTCFCVTNNNCIVESLFFSQSDLVTNMEYRRIPKKEKLKPDSSSSSEVDKIKFRCHRNPLMIFLPSVLQLHGRADAKCICYSSVW